MIQALQIENTYPNGMNVHVVYRKIQDGGPNTNVTPQSELKMRMN